MLVGADQAGRMLEVGVLQSERNDFGVHTMPARAKFLEPTMLRSIQANLHHADDRRKSVRGLRPTARRRTIRRGLIQRAAIARERSERQIVEAVTAAGSKGLSLQRTGELLGSSAQSAQQRFGHLVETA